MIPTLWCAMSLVAAAYESVRALSCEHDDVLILSCADDAQMQHRFTPTMHMTSVMTRCGISCNEPDSAACGVTGGSCI